jgi:hypothetical protein
MPLPCAFLFGAKLHRIALRGKRRSFQAVTP